MPKRIDHTGQRFGRLVVESYEGLTKRGATRWKCRCKCGKVTIVQQHNLKNMRSCGCLRLETIRRQKECATKEERSQRYFRFTTAYARKINPEGFYSLKEAARILEVTPAMILAHIEEFETRRTNRGHLQVRLHLRPATEQEWDRRCEDRIYQRIEDRSKGFLIQANEEYPFGLFLEPYNKSLRV